MPLSSVNGRVPSPSIAISVGGEQNLPRPFTITSSSTSPIMSRISLATYDAIHPNAERPSGSIVIKRRPYNTEASKRRLSLQQQLHDPLRLHSVSVVGAGVTSNSDLPNSDHHQQQQRQGNKISIVIGPTGENSHWTSVRTDSAQPVSTCIKNNTLNGSNCDLSVSNSSAHLYDLGIPINTANRRDQSGERQQQTTTGKPMIIHQQHNLCPLLPPRANSGLSSSPTTVVSSRPPVYATLRHNSQPLSIGISSGGQVVVSTSPRPDNNNNNNNNNNSRSGQTINIYASGNSYGSQRSVVNQPSLTRSQSISLSSQGLDGDCGVVHISTSPGLLVSTRSTGEVRLINAGHSPQGQQYFFNPTNQLTESGSCDSLGSIANNNNHNTNNKDKLVPEIRYRTSTQLKPTFHLSQPSLSLPSSSGSTMPNLPRPFDGLGCSKANPSSGNTGNNRSSLIQFGDTELPSPQYYDMPPRRSISPALINLSHQQLLGKDQNSQSDQKEQNEHHRRRSVNQNINPARYFRIQLPSTRAAAAQPKEFAITDSLKLYEERILGPIQARERPQSWCIDEAVALPEAQFSPNSPLFGSPVSTASSSSSSSSTSSRSQKSLRDLLSSAVERSRSGSSDRAALVTSHLRRLHLVDRNSPTPASKSPLHGNTKSPTTHATRFTNLHVVHSSTPEQSNQQHDRLHSPADFKQSHESNVTNHYSKPPLDAENEVETGFETVRRRRSKPTSSTDDNSSKSDDPCEEEELSPLMSLVLPPPPPWNNDPTDDIPPSSCSAEVANIMNRQEKEPVDSLSPDFNSSHIYGVHIGGEDQAFGSFNSIENPSGSLTTPLSFDDATYAFSTLDSDYLAWMRLSVRDITGQQRDAKQRPVTLSRATLQATPRSQVHCWIDCFNSNPNGLRLNFVDDACSLAGTLRIHMNLIKPVKMSLRQTMDMDMTASAEADVQPDSKAELPQARLISFFLPRGTSKVVFVTSGTTASNAIQSLLDRFHIQESTRKFALYEHTLENSTIVARKLDPDESPLLVLLNWVRISTSRDHFFTVLSQKRIVLQENDACDINWTAFTPAELTNFLRILDKEESEYRNAIIQQYSWFRQALCERMETLKLQNGDADNDSCECPDDFSSTSSWSLDTDQLKTNASCP